VAETREQLDGGENSQRPLDSDTALMRARIIDLRPPARTIFEKD
jgi:hypothetical protein